MDKARLGALAWLALTLGGCVAGVSHGSEEGATASCASSQVHSFICGVEKPEDLARIAGTDWLIASGFAPGAGLKLIDMKKRSARFWYRGGDDQVAADFVRYPDCQAPPDPATFTARGISLRQTAPGQAVLHVVNHGGREAIEIFSVGFDGARPPELQWQGCLAMPPGHVANSVATYKDGTVLTTVLTRPGTTITDFVLGRITGGVFERAPGERSFRLLPGTELPGNNGIETARDDTGFFVVAFGLRQVLAFDRHQTATPLWRATAPEFMPDNIHWDGDRLLAAGMMRDEPACGGTRKVVGGMADMMRCHRGYAVAELDPQARAFRLVAYAEPDPYFSGVSAAVVQGDQLWLGSFQADRIATRVLRPSVD